MKSDMWAEFDILAKLPGMDNRFAATAEHYRRRLNSLQCPANTRQLLERQPFCHCGYSLKQSIEVDLLPAALNDTIKEGLASFRRAILKNGDEVLAELEKLAEGTSDQEVASACRELAAAVRSGNSIPKFTDLQLKVLVEVLDGTSGNAFMGTFSPKQERRAGASGASFADVETDALKGDEILLNV